MSKGVSVLTAHQQNGSVKKRPENLDGRNNSVKIVGPKAKGR